MKAKNTLKKAHRIYLPIIIGVFLLFITITTIAKEVQHIGSVNKNICVSCGDCWAIDHIDFYTDDDGTAAVINPIFDEQKFKEAQRNCPVGAILCNF